MHLQTYVNMPRAYRHKYLNSDKQSALEVDLPFATFCFTSQSDLEDQLDWKRQSTPNALQPSTSNPKGWSSKAELI